MALNRAGRLALALVLVVVALVLGPAPAGAALLASGGPRVNEVGTAVYDENFATLTTAGNPPTANGCYFLDENLDEFSQGVGTYYWQRAAQTQAQCTTNGPAHNSWRFNGTAAGATTTTAAPATTAPPTTSPPTTTAPTTTPPTTAPATTTTTAPAAPGTAAAVADPVKRGKPSFCAPTISECYPAFAQTLQDGSGLTGDPPSGSGSWKMQPCGTTNSAQQLCARPVQSGGNGWTGEVCIRVGVPDLRGNAYPDFVGWSGIPNRQVTTTAYAFGSTTQAAVFGNYSKGTMRVPATMPFPPAAQGYPSDAARDAMTNHCNAVEALSRVDPPSVDCYREFIGNNKVRMRARIGNPTPGATDAVRLSVPWEPGARDGLVAEFDLPAQVVAMPPNGWRGLCLVERTVDIPETNTNWMSSGIITIGDVTPQDLQNFQMEFGYDNAPPSSSFAAGPGVVTGTSALVAWLAQAGGAAVTLSASTVAAATAAAVAGWTLGGVAAGGIASWTGDDPWFCQFNPGYRLARDGYCSQVMEQAQLQRSQVGLQDPNGQWITTTTMRPWKKAWTATEVVINPGKPSVGPRRTTAIAKPQLSNPQQTGLSQSLSQQAGTDRAAVQSSAPNPTISNPAVITPTNTDVDTRGPDPDPAPAPAGDTSGEASGCWTWNPLSWFKGLACFVKWLLLPTPATTNKLGQLWAGLSDKAPFSFVTILGFPQAQFQAMTSTMFASVSSGDCLKFSAFGSAEQPIICAGSPDNPAAYNPVPANIFSPARQIMLLMVRLGLVVLLLHYLQKVFN